MLPPHDEWVGGNSAGPYTSTVDKLLIHTTEGGSIEGAIAAYRANNSWPHLTVDCRPGKPRRRCGHLDMDVAARALRNEVGGVQTNTDGVIQIEVVGQAANPAGIDWAWFGANVVAHICRGLHIPVASQVPWVAYPASYGRQATQRLSPAGWTAVRGLVGHQHVPENSHGDPGAIPIDVILAAARPEPPRPLEDDMPVIYTCPADTNKPFLLSDGSGLSPLLSLDTVIKMNAKGMVGYELTPEEYDAKVTAASIADEVAAVTLYASSMNTQLAELRALDAEQLEVLHLIAS